MDMFFPSAAQISAVIYVVEYIECLYFVGVFEGES